MKKIQRIDMIMILVTLTMRMPAKVINMITIRKSKADKILLIE